MIRKLAIGIGSVIAEIENKVEAPEPSTLKWIVPNLLDPDYFYDADLDFTRDEYFSLQKENVGFLLRPGQMLILSEFEQKNGKYVWEYNVEGCKEKPL